MSVPAVAQLFPLLDDRRYGGVLRGVCDAFVPWAIFTIVLPLPDATLEEISLAVAPSHSAGAGFLCIDTGIRPWSKPMTSRT